MDEIAMLSRKYYNAEVVIDRTGLGEALPEALRQRGLEVTDVFFTQMEKEKMVNHLAMLIEQNKISYPNFPPLMEELKDYTYTITKSGGVKYEASGMRHDDMVTALFLAMKDYNVLDFDLPFVGLLGGVQTNHQVGVKVKH